MGNTHHICNLTFLPSRSMIFILEVYTCTTDRCSYTWLLARPTSPLAGSCSAEEGTNTQLPFVHLQVTPTCHTRQLAPSLPRRTRTHTNTQHTHRIVPRAGGQVVRVGAELHLAQAVLLHVRQLKVLVGVVGLEVGEHGGTFSVGCTRVLQREEGGGWTRPQTQARTVESAYLTWLFSIG